MNSINVEVIKNYVRNRLVQKFGAEAIYKKYEDKTVPFGEFYNGKTLYQVSFYDRRAEYSSSTTQLCFIDKSICDEMVKELKEFNDEIKIIYDELLKNIIDNDYIVNPSTYDFDKKIKYSHDLCNRFEIPCGDFDWRVVAGYLDEHYLGYFNLGVYTRNKKDEEEEERKNYRNDDTSEELGPHGGAFKDEADYWKYKEGYYL